MRSLDDGDVKLELLVGRPAQTALRLAEMIEQDKELLLGDRLAEP